MSSDEMEEELFFVLLLREASVFVVFFVFFFFFRLFFFPCICAFACEPTNNENKNTKEKLSVPVLPIKVVSPKLCKLRVVQTLLLFFFSFPDPPPLSDASSSS